MSDESQGDYDELSDVEEIEEIEEDEEKEEGSEKEEDEIEDSEIYNFYLKLDSNINHDEIIIVPDNDKITSDRMTKYELTEAISIRATEISQKNNAFIKNHNYDDPVKIAKLEMNENKNPLLLRREVGYKYNAKLGKKVMHIEQFYVSDMIKPKFEIE